MRTEKLDQSTWKSFFDRVTKQLEGKQAFIEVASLSLGDQVEAKWLPLLGISHDPKSNLIEIALDGLDHMIRNPLEVYVAWGGEGLQAIEVMDGENTKQIVQLRDPMMLPAPK